MLTAIVVTLIALVVLVVAAVFAFRIRQNRTGDKTPKKMRVNAISSVGVAAHAPKTTMSSSSAPTISSATMPKEGLRNRFVAMGAIVAVVFGALATKLFGLQILDNASYRKEAEQNLYTTVSTPAPRGIIYDADGNALVSNRQVQTVLADADVAHRPDVILRLSVICGIPYEVVKARILDSSSGAQSQRVVASDVSLQTVAFITEHSDALPGVSTQIRSTRQYPYGALGAHVLGYTGTASADDLKEVQQGRSIEMGDAVGKAGIEQSYDAVLAGDHGQRTLVTDASGDIQQVVSEVEPTKGSDVYLTISAPVQYAVDSALKELVNNHVGTAASCVVMDVKTGGILALGNYPTYEPETFIGGISQEVWDAYQTEESHYPLMNRAIAGTYPAASCFKAFTGLAGLTYGFANAGKTWVCSGTWTGFGEQFPQKCWQHSGHGTLDLREGVIESCDVVFYEIAKDFYNARNSIGNDAMQDFVKEFGYDNYTGIDLSGEARGRIPTPEWKSEYFRDVPQEAQWLPGDISNMVIGQGYVLVTPIQVARAYAAVATGKLLKPHLLKEVKNSLGDTVVTAETQEDAAPEVTDTNFEIMRNALRGVALENSSVSQDFGQYTWSAAAKTGTAEVAGKKDFAWFACYAPFEDPKYSLALIIEEGGSGGSVASPIAAKIMDVALKYGDGALDTPAEKITA